MDNATREKIARNASAVYKPQSIMEQLTSVYPSNASRVKIEKVRDRKNGRAILEQMEKHAHAIAETTETFARDGDAEIARNLAWDGKDRNRVTVLDRGTASNSNGFACH